MKLEIRPRLFPIAKLAMAYSFQLRPTDHFNKKNIRFCYKDLLALLHNTNLVKDLSCYYEDNQ